VANTDWSKEETDHLFDLCEQFSLRFIVIADRFGLN
jgi:DNA methyltransferase 1-associated protein 1